MQPKISQGWCNLFFQHWPAKLRPGYSHSNTNFVRITHSSCLIHFLCCRKLKWEDPKQIYSGYTFWTQTTVKQHFQTLMQVQRKFPYFRIHGVTQQRSFPWKLTYELKGKHQEKKLMEFHQCLPSDEHAQLTPLASGPVSEYGSTYLCKRHFSR